MRLTLVPDAIEAYAAAHSTPLPPLLDELTATTETEMGVLSRMISGQIEGMLLQTLLLLPRTTSLRAF